MKKGQEKIGVSDISSMSLIENNRSFFKIPIEKNIKKTTKSRKKPKNISRKLFEHHFNFPLIFYTDYEIKLICIKLYIFFIYDKSFPIFKYQ